MLFAFAAESRHIADISVTPLCATSRRRPIPRNDVQSIDQTTGPVSNDPSMSGDMPDSTRLERPRFTASGVWPGSVEIAPIAASEITFSSAFGVGASAKGVAASIMVFMSVAIYAGASQSAVLDVLVRAAAACNARANGPCRQCVPLLAGCSARDVAATSVDRAL